MPKEIKTFLIIMIVFKLIVITNKRLIKRN
jgi:hypothetical protein